MRHMPISARTMSSGLTSERISPARYSHFVPIPDDSHGSWFAVRKQQYALGFDSRIGTRCDDVL